MATLPTPVPGSYGSEGHDPSWRLPPWLGRSILFLPVPLMIGAMVLLHLGALADWQESLGQAAVVLIGFTVWALWARANEADLEG